MELRELQKNEEGNGQKKEKKPPKNNKNWQFAELIMTCCLVL